MAFARLAITALLLAMCGCRMADPVEHGMLHRQGMGVARPVENTPPEDTEANALASPEVVLEALRVNVQALRAERWRVEASAHAGAPCGTVAMRLAPDPNGDPRLTERYARQRTDAPGNAEHDCLGLARMAAHITLAYTVPQFSALRRTVEGGTLMAEGGFHEYAAAGFVMPEDRVALRLDAATGRPRAMRFETVHEGTRVLGETEFRELPGGPAYPARTQVVYAGRGVSVTIQQFPQPH